MRKGAKLILIFITLLSLLCVSSQASISLISSQKGASKNSEKKLVVKSVQIEATVNYTQVVVSQYFLVKVLQIFSKQKLFIPTKIINPTFINQYKKILFSRIIPTKAP